MNLTPSEATFSTEFWNQLISNPESEAGAAESRQAPAATQLRVWHSRLIATTEEPIKRATLHAAALPRNSLRKVDK